MKKNKMVLIFCGLVLTLGVYSCDPQRMCNEPKCMYSDVNTLIQGHFSGNLDSVIHIGDTIRFYMKIPDTMSTNYGNIVFGQLLKNSFFGITSGGCDTIKGSGVGAFYGLHDLSPVYIKYSLTPSGRETWNYDNREFECLFIPKEKGRYLIQFIPGRIEMKAKDGKEWLINPGIIIDAPKRFQQYLSWMDSSMRAEAYNGLIHKVGWYWFEVK